MVKVENIKVAVRVRPFNDREKAKECKNIVSMVKRTSILADPNNPAAVPRAFTFDHSYWSHDGFKEEADGYLEPDNDKYVDQHRLFKELGTGIIHNIWTGYNCTLFAYGQTGSGKSYTMMGYGANKGIIPQLCEKLFEDMAIKKEQRSTNKVVYQVSFSMLEIYNEKVRDLLSKTDQPKQGLPVRMSKTDGFYVEGLTTYPVAVYRDIEYYIEEGNKNRTLAATKMNETSSRAHTIVKINFAQNYFRENRTTQSKIYLVDLAGSERASQTGATGVRFEESKNINKSLMTLGTVIKIPHRDSKLTLLLKDAIGGNCKTIMVATISPSDENYDQTLSTLRYADRVKSIKNSVKMNVAATDKLIKDLLIEKEQILATLGNKSNADLGYTQEEIQKLREEQQAEIERIKSEMNNVEAAWQKRLQETQRQMEEQIAEERKEEKERAENPHIWNLNEDPALSGKVYYLIKEGVRVTVGNPRATIRPNIALHGPWVYFGTNNIFVFYHPEEKNALEREKKPTKKITFELAQNEISKHTKVQTCEEQRIQWLKQEVAEMLARTQDANAMAVELRKNISFEPVVVANLVLGESSQRAKVYVRVKTENGGEFLWGKNSFLDRYDLMMDVFQKYENGDENWNPESQAQDPFWEPLETPTLIGVAYLPTECIAYMLDIKDQKIGIYDYESCLAGYLNISLVPCRDDGKECGEDRAVEEPIDLVGSDVAFRLKIEGATGIPKRFKSSWCQYSFYMGADKHYTDEVEGVVPKYKYDQLHRIFNVSAEMIKYLEDSSIMIEIYGRQSIVASDNKSKGLLSAHIISDLRRSFTSLYTVGAALGNRRDSRDRRDSNYQADTESSVENSDVTGTNAESTSRAVENFLVVPQVVIADPEYHATETTSKFDASDIISSGETAGTVVTRTDDNMQNNDIEQSCSAKIMEEMRRGIGQVVDKVMNERGNDNESYY